MLPPITHTAGELPLQLTAEDRTHLTSQVVDAADRFLDELDGVPASFGPTDPRLIADLLAPPPERGGADIATLLDTVLTAANSGFDTAGGGHLSYVPNGGIYTAALGRFLGAVLNRWTGAAFAQPGAVALEQSVIDWMIDLFGLGPSAAGVLLSGGSIANFEAVVAARTAFGTRFDDAVIYVSERAHHSVAKAARLAGIPPSGVHNVPVDHRLQLDPAALATLLTVDRAAGLRPMMIVATAGTTDTGSVDPLDACADIAEANDVWFHVDAAYGGFFTLTERGSVLLAGIDRADSITVDAHKGLLIPFGVGGLLVADREQLTRAHVGRGVYMQDGLEDPLLPDYSALSVELSRPHRGLDLWLPLHLHGVAAFRAELDRMLDLAQRAAARLEAIPGIELTAAPALSIVGFRCTAGDAATESVLTSLNQSGEVHVSSTSVDGLVAARLAFLNHRTTEATADRAVDLVAAALSCAPSATKGA